MGATLEHRESSSLGLPSFVDCVSSILLTDELTHLLVYYAQLLTIMTVKNLALMNTYRICVVKVALPPLVKIHFLFLVQLLFALQYHTKFTE